MNSHLQKVWTPPFKTPSCTPDRDLSTVDFFVGPPREIGDLICANSTLSKQVSEKKLLMSVATVSALLVTVTLFFFSLVPSFYVLATGSGICVLLVAAIVCTEKVYCYFIGKVGICESFTKLQVPGKPKTKTLLFDKTASLFVTQVRQNVNGIYAGTSYKFVWIQTDKTKYIISGNYFGEKKKRGSRDKYYFAELAESAWTRHLLTIVDKEFEEKGYVDFPMCEKSWQNKIQTIRMRKGSLEFFPKKGDSQTVKINDFKHAQLQGGYMLFKHKDAQWWGGSGSFSFTYSLMPNAYLFLICLNRIVGF